MDKIHSSMANLEALTSKLKMSFGDQENSEPENKENVEIDNKKVALPKPKMLA